MLHGILIHWTSDHRNQAITLVSEDAYTSLNVYTGGLGQSTISIVDVETKSASGVCPVQIVSASIGTVSMGLCACTVPFSLNVGFCCWLLLFLELTLIISSFFPRSGAVLKAALELTVLA